MIRGNLDRPFQSEGTHKQPTPEGPVLGTPRRGYYAFTLKGPRMSYPSTLTIRVVPVVPLCVLWLLDIGFLTFRLTMTATIADNASESFNRPPLSSPLSLTFPRHDLST